MEKLKSLPTYSTVKTDALTLATENPFPIPTSNGRLP
jgi:hypothetical protein